MWKRSLPVTADDTSVIGEVAESLTNGILPGLLCIGTVHFHRPALIFITVDTQFSDSS